MMEATLNNCQSHLRKGKSSHQVIDRYKKSLKTYILRLRLEEVGFEPTKHLSCLHAFQAGSIGHSDTPP